MTNSVATDFATMIASLAVVDTMNFVFAGGSRESTRTVTAELRTISASSMIGTKDGFTRVVTL